jgi:2-polyprenyl-3-methyl-5-hydroxy-6-metoxy-1,4-benzoquinol methylase
MPEIPLYAESRLLRGTNASIREHTFPTATAPTPDFAAIKQRQQATWASGDYHMIGTQILITAEQLFESLDVHSTERVLDVATGSGNAALAAARRGCDVIGIDYVPSLLERARERAVSEGVQAVAEQMAGAMRPLSRRRVHRLLIT